MILFQPFIFLQQHPIQVSQSTNSSLIRSTIIPWLQRLCLVLLALSNETRVALLICATGTETGADESRPCAALEEEDGEDNAEGEAEGGADEKGGEAAVPLRRLLAGVLV